MASIEPFVLKIKPALDAYLRAPSRGTLSNLEHELAQFDWMHMRVYNVQVLVPLVLKLEELSAENQDLRTGTMHCITLVTSKIYLKELTALRTMLVVVLKQVRERNAANVRPNLSEEIKLAAVDCIAECLTRSTTDVLEQFYTNESAMLLGQVLLTLVELIEREKYKKLIISALECLMIVFYVHDGADRMDVVLRNQVADTIFIYLPKIITVLYRSSLADDKLGEKLKSTAIKALGRILCVIYEETTEDIIHIKYDIGAFTKLLNDSLRRESDGKLPPVDNDNVLSVGKSPAELETRLRQMQIDGRTAEWVQATSRKLRPIFIQISVLRCHQSANVRREYAILCCTLMQQCAHNLRDSFMFMLESVVAMSVDDDAHVRRLCEESIERLQHSRNNEDIFDENCELLFDEHLTRLPRIINRSDEAEQYGELMFLLGFFRSLSPSKLQYLLSMPRNMEMFCMCLLCAVDLKIGRDLLAEEYSLRQVDAEGDYEDSAKLPWRQFKNLNSVRCIRTVEELCTILGRTPVLSRILFDYLLELLSQRHEAMNEIILLLLWMSAPSDGNPPTSDLQSELVRLLLDELLCDQHWHLALQPDRVTRLKVNKPSNWFVDHTPGLYESAIEIRTQDYDSDDENDYSREQNKNRVSIADAQFNVLHSCIVLDAMGHCASYLGELFDGYLFRSLHRILLKMAHSNTMVYLAATYALISIQKALRFARTTQLIESYTDYITYHLNTLLKRTPESKSAVDILTVVLQFSTRNALPHLQSIFETISEECSKSHQEENINSYIRVFSAFLRHIGTWLLHSDAEIENVPMQVDDALKECDILPSWLEALHKPSISGDDIRLEPDAIAESLNQSEPTEQTANVEAEEVNTDLQLPRHIEMIKSILNEVLKFVSSADRVHQILALECLIVGVPLLQKYENELLPLVHKIWQPLMEKFRQRNAVVLNRCFTLLSVLATYAKDFILKRSLNDVIPFLKMFLKEAAAHSATEMNTVPTQEYKLQLKLLQEFPNLIESIEIDGKHLCEISEITSTYLSKEQPQELQDNAVKFYTKLRHYNGPLVYVVVLKRSHLKQYQENVSKVLAEFGIK